MHMIRTKGQEWEQEIAQRALHKLMHSLGDKSDPDPERVEQLRSNIQMLFYIFWTRSAITYLKCALGVPLNGALAQEQFDPTHVDHNKHLDSAMAQKLDTHPDVASDLVLLSEDVTPDEVNEALSICWQILRDSAPQDATADQMLDMFSSASVQIMQALVGFLTEALTTHMAVSEERGATADRLGRDLDASFANFLSTCGKRVMDLMASSAVGASRIDGDSDDEHSDFSPMTPGNY